MDDLISRAATILAVEEYLQWLDSCISDPKIKIDGYKNGLKVAIYEIKKATAVDAVHVVRCKDCKYRVTGNPDKDCDICAGRMDWYCACGKRKENDE